MRKRSSTPDPNTLAFNLVQRATSGKRPARNPAAVALGRLGGLKGGRARAASLSKDQRSKIAKKAARARWGRSKA